MKFITDQKFEVEELIQEMSLLSVMVKRGVE